jgi:hypothetical protein
MKDLGMCKDCGKPIRAFKYALTDWLCKYCYEAKFPQPGNERLSGARPKKSYLKNEESYEFLKEHLYNKPGLYKRSFQVVRDYSPLLRNFASLRHLLDFTLAVGGTTYRPGIVGCKSYFQQPNYVQLHRRCISEIKMELVNLARTHQWLFPRVTEILLFVLWDDLVDKYGKGERFSQGYLDLILEISPDEQSAVESAVVPAVPQANKDLWNYMGSNILSAAVSQGVISQLEAEVVMEVVVYDRDWFDIQEILGVATGEAFYLYETGLTKLGKWAKRNVLVLASGQIICD